MDEVGRGCLAGPVVACAVIMPDGYEDGRIIDSKKIPEKKREIIAASIRNNAVDFAFGVVCSGIIDSVNILRATRQAMHIALSRLKTPYDNIIVDAVKLSGIHVPIENPFKAEDSHMCVAAASILAKVYRDAMMKKLHMTFPEYGWYSNKGYGAKVHLDALKKFGATEIHRMSFLKNADIKR
jgi:ribonuclease HII